MSAAPPGAIVRITYDWDVDGEAPSEGSILVTPSGRRYRVLEARRVRSRVSPERYRLTCSVLAEDAEDLPTHPLVWNKR